MESYIIPTSEYKNRLKKIEYRFKKNKTSKKNVTKILYNYEKSRGSKNKILVLCHGKFYDKKYKNCLLVDKEVNVKPDIIMDIWTSLHFFPKNYFDVIIMEHCNMGNINEMKENNFPFHINVNILWDNIKNILKPGGIIKNDYILNLYSRFIYKKQFDGSKKIINEVINKLLKIGCSDVKYKKKYKNIHEIIITK